MYQTGKGVAYGMVGGPMLTELFTYQYRPYSLSQNASDGGFKLALFGNNTLVYTTFNRMQSVMAVYTFLISPEVLARYMMMLDGEGWWLSRQPLNISGQGRVGYKAMMGVTGHPMFSVDDLEDLVRRPFNDERGLLARRMCVMLENVSELLIPCGLYMTPHSFVWDNRVTGPIPMTEPMMAI